MPNYESLREAFKIFDANNSGGIDRAEFKAILMRGPKGVTEHNADITVNKLFERFDKNGDNVISFDEFCKVSSGWMGIITDGHDLPKWSFALKVATLKIQSDSGLKFKGEFEAPEGLPGAVKLIVSPDYPVRSMWWHVYTGTVGQGKRMTVVFEQRNGGATGPLKNNEQMEGALKRQLVIMFPATVSTGMTLSGRLTEQKMVQEPDRYDDDTGRIIKAKPGERMWTYSGENKNWALTFLNVQCMGM